MARRPRRSRSHERRRGGGRALVDLPIVTGSLWILFSLMMFRFDYASVSAISILFGVVCIAAALEELVSIPSSHGWWRLGRIALAVLFAVIGIVAFVHPGNTFDALAAVFAFFLILRGMFTIVAAITHFFEPMWLGLLAGDRRDRPRPSGRPATSATRRSCCSSGWA